MDVKNEGQIANAGTSEGLSSNGSAPPAGNGIPASLSRDRRPMPSDFTVTVFGAGGTDRHLLHPPTQRRQPMRGFDDIYVDIVDYIIRITHRIWEQKDIGYIYDTYRHNAVVHNDAGLSYGREQVVINTINTINAFPDVRVFADEVIWAGNEDTGFYTSHRGTFVGHNTGYSQWGPPNGKKIVVWACANCVSLENEIFEEWVLENAGSFLQQLGFDLFALARDVGNQLPANSLNDHRYGDVERLPGQNKPPHFPPKASGTADIEDFVRRAYHYIWNWRMLGRVDDAYAANLRFHGSTDREYYGRGEYKSFLLSILAMFPDLEFQIDDLYWMGNERDGYQVAIRWSLVGTHRGYGPYGPPTGRRIYMWGITQDTIKGGKIIEEWMQFNEFYVMQQILRDEPLTV